MTLNIFIIAIAATSMALLNLETYAAIIPEHQASGQALGAQDPPASFKHLGELNGTNYYVDTTVSLNWHDGGSHCRSAQLKLASMRTPTQAQFLADALISRNLQDKELWTIATDCKLEGMGCRLPELYWADSFDGEGRVGNIFNVTTLSVPNACGTFTATDLFGSTFSSKQCLTAADGVLCQI